MRESEFDPQLAREFTRLFFAFRLALEGTCLPKIWEKEKSNGIDFSWPAKKIFIPRNGLFPNCDRSDEIRESLSNAQMRKEIEANKLAQLTNKEGEADTHAYDQAKLESEVLEIFLHDRRRRFEHTKPHIPKIITTDEKRMIPAFGKGYKSLGGLSYSPFQNRAERARAFRALEKITTRLNRKTEFQIWLEQQVAFTDAVELLKRKPMKVFPLDQYRHDIIEQYEGMVEQWAFEYMIARALLAYFCYKHFAHRMQSVHLTLVIDPKDYSERARSLAAKLAEELRSHANAKWHLLQQLEAVSAPGSKSFQGMPLLVKDASIQRRRSIFIRELAVLGPLYLQNKRSKTGRFPPDVIVQACKLVSHGLANERSVNEQLQKIEASEEKHPLTYPDGGSTPQHLMATD